MHRLPEWIQGRIEPEPNTGCWSQRIAALSGMRPPR